MRFGVAMDEAERLMLLGWAKLPTFKKKIEQAKLFIRQALDISPAIVSVSWGKDSIVMLHLAQQINPDILAVHYASPESHAGITSNFPEVIKSYLSRFNTNYRYLVAEPGWAFTPTSTKDRVHSMIDTDFYRMDLIGVRAEESKERQIAVSRYGAIHQYTNGLWRCFPLAYWKTRDIWAYIALHDLPYLIAYNYSDRTNPHAVFWFSQDKRHVDEQREVIRKHNPTLDDYLEQRYNDEKM